MFKQNFSAKRDKEVRKRGNLMNEFLERARELESEMLADRHHIHENAEAGEHLPNTTAYVMQRLKEIGLEPKEICDSGVVALIEGAKPGKTIMIRADMDALPMPENNDLSFHTKTEAAHNCGHDMHTSMLLCAAKMLLEKKDELKGNVKLMFQPSEELFTGSKKMIDAGLLDNPKVDAAFAMHVMLDHPKPALNYCCGFMSSSCDGFKITIHGRGSHGAMPELGVDPINIGTHIYCAFQNLIARETPSKERAILTFGQFSAGSTPNIVPNEAELMGTLRTYNKDLREKLVARMHEICENIGRAFGAQVDYEVLSDVPSCYSNPELTTELAGYAAEVEDGFILDSAYQITPSDDIAFVSEKVPTAYFMLEAQVPGCTVQHHNPGVLFNEDCMVYGAATHATCVFNWLNNN